jgi:phage terminase large subunit-like protein
LSVIYQLATDEVIKSSEKSRSKWVADLIKAKLKDEWPEDFFKLAGSWEEEETPEEIMATIGSRA